MNAAEAAAVAKRVLQVVEPIVAAALEAAAVAYGGPIAGAAASAAASVVESELAKIGTGQSSPTLTVAEAEATVVRTLGESHDVPHESGPAGTPAA